jgi:hypothetical protein
MKALLRAGELSGRLTDPVTGTIDPARVQHFLDQAQKINSATHGVVGAQALLGLAQQGGGIGLRGLSDEGFYTEAVMAQVMGGQRAGTATLGIMQQLSRGIMTKTTGTGMEDVGPLKPGEWSIDHGRVIIDAEVSKRLTAMFADGYCRQDHRKPQRTGRYRSDRTDATDDGRIWPADYPALHGGTSCEF